MSAFDDRRGMGNPAPQQWWDKIAPPAGFSTDPRPKGWVDPATPSMAQWQKPLSPEQQALADAFARAIMNSIQTVELAPHQAKPFRGELFEQDGRLIIPSTDATADQGTAGDAVATATGATFTSDGPSQNVSIISFRVPDSMYALVKDCAIRCDSETGYTDMQFTVLIGGRKIRPINARTLTFYRDGWVDLWSLAQPGQLVDLQASNSSAINPHYVEAVMRGWYFPPSMVGDSLKALIQNNSSRS